MINPQIEIGPLTFHLYGIIISVAVILGWSIAKRKAPFYKIPQELFDDKILFVPLVLSIIFARAYHVLHYYPRYLENPITILQIQNGGLGIWGGLLGLFIGLIFISNIKKISFLKLADVVSPSLLLGQSIGRLGNYINQEGFGPPTQKAWGVFIDVINRPLEFRDYSRFHPTFFYEAILDLLFFAILFKYAKSKRKNGQVFALYLLLYATGRLVAENWRIDTWVVYGVKTAYILCLLALLIGALLFLKLQKSEG